MVYLNLHNLTTGHCNIQGGFVGISKSTQITQMIKKHSMNIISLNETNLNDSIIIYLLIISLNGKIEGLVIEGAVDL